MKYEFSSREPLRGPIEYNKSYLKVKKFEFYQREKCFFLLV
jgi:hypothetical protein